MDNYKEKELKELKKLHKEFNERNRDLNGIINFIKKESADIETMFNNLNLFINYVDLCSFDDIGVYYTYYQKIKPIQENKIDLFKTLMGDLEKVLNNYYKLQNLYNEELEILKDNCIINEG